MAEHEVLIAGGGPTGLMLAGELALAKVDVAIVERRATPELDGLRAGGLHARTLEVFDQRGIADRFVSRGQVHRMAPFAGGIVDISDLPTRHSYSLALWQTDVEKILADWIAELGVPLYRGCEVAEFVQDETGVEVKLAGNRLLRAKYLAGCDGGRSAIRKQAGIAFDGWDATASYLIAEMETGEEPAWGFRRTEHGMNAIGKIDDGKRARVVLHEPRLRQSDEPAQRGGRERATIADLRDALIGVYGTDFGLKSASYVSRFTDMARQAASYRAGRVLLAGDAAHVHSPIGGQGLNLGVQDAVNLGWKLASVVHGRSPESLLDTYHAERHRVGARVLRNTMALTALERSCDRVEALRGLMGELIQAEQARKQYFAMMAGLDIHYDFGTGHPLLGRRMPDIELTTVSGAQRVFTLLHDARPLLLNLGKPGAIDLGAWADRVRAIDAGYAGSWELPAIGPVTGPEAVFIRPDGYVGWVGDATQAGLADALRAWCGQS